MVAHINRSNREKVNKTGKVLVALDKQSLALWNRRKRSGENMSEWVRTQLQHHFSAYLSPEQKLAVLHEELLQAQAARDRVMAEYEDVINAKAREMVRLRAQLVENNLVPPEDLV